MAQSEALFTLLVRLDLRAERAEVRLVSRVVRAVISLAALGLALFNASSVVCWLSISVMVLWMAVEEPEHNHLKYLKF